MQPACRERSRASTPPVRFRMLPSNILVQYPHCTGGGFATSGGEGGIGAARDASKFARMGSFGMSLCGTTITWHPHETPTSPPQQLQKRAPPSQWGLPSLPVCSAMKSQKRSVLVIVSPPYVRPAKSDMDPQPRDMLGLYASLQNTHVFFWVVVAIGRCAIPRIYPHRGGNAIKKEGEYRTAYWREDAYAGFCRGCSAIRDCSMEAFAFIVPNINFAG